MARLEPSMILDFHELGKFHIKLYLSKEPGLSFAKVDVLPKDTAYKHALFLMRIKMPGESSNKYRVLWMGHIDDSWGAFKKTYGKVIQDENDWVSMARVIFLIARIPGRFEEAI